MGLTSGLASSWDSKPTPQQGWAAHWGQSTWNRAGQVGWGRQGCQTRARPGELSSPVPCCWGGLEDPEHSLCSVLQKSTEAGHAGELPPCPLSLSSEHSWLGRVGPLVTAGSVLRHS